MKNINSLRLFIFVMTCLIISAKGFSMDLKKYKWNNRLLIVNSLFNETNEKQKKAFDKMNQENIERNLLFISSSDEVLNKRIGLSSDGFSMILVGKDGNAKNRYDSLVEMTDIYETIDSMPMRQAEMKSRVDK